MHNGSDTGPNDQIPPSSGDGNPQMEVDTTSSSVGSNGVGVPDAVGSNAQSFGSGPGPSAAQPSTGARDVMINNITRLVREAVQEKFNELGPVLDQQVNARIDENLQQLRQALQPDIQTLRASVASGGPTEDEDMDESLSDDSASSPSSSPKKHRTIASTRALRKYLEGHNVVCRERNSLPILDTLPQCAIGGSVEAYANRIHLGPKLDEGPLFYWPDSLRTCPWNHALVKLLANDYHAKLEANSIKHRGLVVPYDPSVSVPALIKLIRTRLRDTQKHWQKNEARRAAQEDPSQFSNAERTEANTKARNSRRHNRAKRLLDDRLEYINRYYKSRTIHKPLTTMLTKLTATGMNAAVSDDESDDLTPTRHFWISPDIANVLEEIDRQKELTKARLMKSQPKRRRGNKSTPIRGLPRVITDSEAALALPQNWYRREWFNACSPCEQQDLDFTDETPIPLLEDLKKAYNELTSN